MGLWQMLLVLLLGVAIGSVDKAMFVAVVVLGAVTWLVHKCMGCGGGGGGDAGDNGGGGGGTGDSTAMQGPDPRWVMFDDMRWTDGPGWRHKNSEL